MHTWAVLAAKEAAIASGLAGGIVPAVGASSLDCFAIGALMSGTCILMLTAPRRGRRRGLASAPVGQALAAARGRGKTAVRGTDRRSAREAEAHVPEADADEARMPAGGADEAMVPESGVDEARMPAGGADEAIVPESGADEAMVPEAAAVEPVAAGDEAPIAAAPQQPDESGSGTGEGQDVAAGGYRSRHRLSDQNLSPKRPGTRRNSPRHAAPPASFSSRMTGRIAVRGPAGGVRS